MDPQKAMQYGFCIILPAKGAYLLSDTQGEKHHPVSLFSIRAIFFSQTRQI